MTLVVECDCENESLCMSALGNVAVCFECACVFIRAEKYGRRNVHVLGVEAYLNSRRQLGRWEIGGEA